MQVALCNSLADFSISKILWIFFLLKGEMRVPPTPCEFISGEVEIRVPPQTCPNYLPRKNTSSASAFCNNCQHEKGDRDILHSALSKVQFHRFLNPPPIFSFKTGNQIPRNSNSTEKSCQTPVAPPLSPLKPLPQAREGEREGITSPQLELSWNSVGVSAVCLINL